ncbi:MAG: quinohemoprotein ethanol dehydrogenase [Bermanella sp.]|jgi:quinohemoprotein ethanol dehydrogenase
MKRALFTSVLVAMSLLAACSKEAVEVAIQKEDFAVTLVNAGAASDVWLSHGRTYSEQRFSPLKHITTDNIDKLGLAWAFDLGVSRGIEATPIVADGRIFISATENIVYALDAKTGAQLWRFDPQIDRSKLAHLCCDAVNRGVAFWDGKIITGTIDGRLIALDAATGRKVWDVPTIDQDKPYTITGAPRVVKGKVIIGNGGAEFGVRGYVSAYDVNNGKLLWRFYTVPGNPDDGFESDAMKMAAETWKGSWWEHGGGGTAWDSMAYDPELDLLYIGVGNGSPWNQSVRSPGGGDNLFLSSIVAVRPDTGEYVWHYQTTPGDNWDYTATQHMILADLEIKGKKRKVIMQAPKNGFFYVIDRASGEFISAENYVDVNWATHVDTDTGRPVEVPEARAGGKDFFMQTPGPTGGHNWHPMSFSQQTGLVYIPTYEGGFIFADDPDYKHHDVGWNTGYDVRYGSFPTDMAQFKALRAATKGQLVAWDPVAQKAAWAVDHGSPWNGGLLSTAGGLVFQGNADAKFVAYNAKTGERLWNHFAQTAIVAAPISYAIDGEQYIAVASGWGGTFALIYGGLFPAESAPGVGRLMVFKLGGKAQLPAIAERHLSRPTPPAQSANSSMLVAGEVLYAGNCIVCHGDNVVSSGLLPDLRWTPLLAVPEAWNSVILGGARAGQGMPSFGSKLSKDDTESIRQYVISQAHKPFEDQIRE